jgi:hypothetical protein
MNNFFYDGQIRRFISQFISLVSNFEVEFGRDDQGVSSTQRVPVLYGDQSRQAAQIIQGNSENTLNRVPAMAVYVSGLQYDRERVQNPTLVQKVHLRQRQYDPETGTYNQRQGDAYTIERLMPVPYKLSLKLDIWTSNTEQKLQLIEQISQLFNPAMEIQNTDNYIDWSSLSYALLNDVNWDSRTVPVGQDNPISIATMTFELPIWISPSIKVKKLGVIHNIFNNLSEIPQDFTWGSRLISLRDYGVQLTSDPSGVYSLRLLKSGGVSANESIVTLSTSQTWESLLGQYGNFVAGSSQIRLRQPTGSEIIGTGAISPIDPYLMIYNPFPDTLPANTLGPINAIVDPLNVNVESKLANPNPGTRYLLTQDIGNWDNYEGAIAWRGSDGRDLVAQSWDIVEYNGVFWEVVFDNLNNTEIEYVTNLTTGVQYRWENQSWIKSFDGVYPGGTWGLAL